MRNSALRTETTNSRGVKSSLTRMTLCRRGRSVCSRTFVRVLLAVLAIRRCFPSRPRMQGQHFRTPRVAGLLWRRARRSGLLLVLVDGGKSAHPGLRRAEPILPLRDELIALAQDSDTHRIGCLLPLARRGRIDRRPAARAEGLHARIAAVGRRLDVIRRLPGHPERGARDRDRDAERRTGAGLAIGAVADLGLLRIGLAFDGDIAAVAGAVDFHGSLAIRLSPPVGRGAREAQSSCSASFTDSTLCSRWTTMILASFFPSRRSSAAMICLCSSTAWRQRIGDFLATKRMLWIRNISC